jgi:hypothetical protein
LGEKYEEEIKGANVKEKGRKEEREREKGRTGKEKEKWK